jgi:thiol-disulfide isomerase/thioredoxin
MTDEPIWLACLCAAWCRVCDDYAETLREVAAEFPQLSVRWIDIEDEADLLGDVDVETFPMLLIGDAQRLWFAGPVLPQADVLRRLLSALARSRAGAGSGDPALHALADRLRDADR